MPRKSFDRLAPIPPRLVGQLPITKTQYCFPPNHADRSAGAKMTTPALFSGSWSSNAVWRGSELARSTAISPWRRKRASDRDASILRLPFWFRIGGASFLQGVGFHTQPRTESEARVPSGSQHYIRNTFFLEGPLPRKLVPPTLISRSRSSLPFRFSLSPPLPSPSLFAHRLHALEARGDARQVGRA